MLTKNKRLFRFDSCLTLQNAFFFSFDIVFLLYRFRFFSLYFVFLLYRFRRFFSLDFVFLLYRFRWILFSFRFVSFLFVSQFTGTHIFLQNISKLQEKSFINNYLITNYWFWPVPGPCMVTTFISNRYEYDELTQFSPRFNFYSPLSRSKTPTYSYIIF